MITVSPGYIYQLDNGDIWRLKQYSYRKASFYGNPPGTVAQIMASMRFLYALMSDGAVYRRWHNSDSWAEYEPPGSTVQLSSSDDNIYLLGNSIERRHEAGGSASILYLDRTGVVMIDHDETYVWALFSDGSIRFAHPGSGWSVYSQALPNIASIAASSLYLFAIDSGGMVWRSKTDEQAGWSRMRTIVGATGIAVSASHSDRLWYEHEGKVKAQNVLNWLGVTPPPFAQGWVTKDWVEQDWVAVK